MKKRVTFLAVVLLFAALTAANSTVAVTSLFGSNMVLQRDKPVPVWGTAAPSKTITVTYNSQTKTTTSDAQGNWKLTLDAMAAKTSGSNFTVNEAGANTLTFSNVVVGDVWVCSGQSNMAFSLSGCNRQTEDVNTANYPGIRHIWVPLLNTDVPQKTFSSSWSVCSPSTAAGFSAVAFYFGRKIYTDQSLSIPIGLIASTVGGTCIDPWLAPEGGTDIPVIAPIYSQSIMPWGPFCLFNGMIYPLAPFPVKGGIWYQGESMETTKQSDDSYYLKEKALIQGWKRLWGMDEFPFYIVQIANYGNLPTGDTPDAVPASTWADIRVQQTNALGLPHTGMAVTIDVGEQLDIHPKDKQDVGNRLAYWALKNDYGRSTIVPSGPILKDATVSGNKIICTFDYVGDRLMVGLKTPYQPTAEVVAGTLTRFSIAGATGSWYAGNATIVGNTVEVTSPSVASPRKVAYACWQNPAGANLYNKVTLDGAADGLPASPFYVGDASATGHVTVTASAGAGGSISPAGATTYLKRMTALYTITPDSGYYIQDVKVDNVSIGAAVKTYTFDPLYVSHTISATFVATTAPNYTVAASSNAGGSISPSGSISVAQGGSQSFSIIPSAGCIISSVTVDSKAMGARSGVTFGDVRTNHTISATFACGVTASASFGGSVTPSGTTYVPYGSNQTYAITPLTGYSISDVKADGVSVGVQTSYTFTNVTTNHTISASFSGGAGGVGSIPQTGQIIFSAIASSITSDGSWSTNYPTVQSLAKIGTPTLETINNRKWEKNVNVEGDGYRFGNSYSSSIACTGATIVAAVKPTRMPGDTGNWRSVVDVFYDRLVLGVMNDTGKVCVRRNGSLELSATAIPDGQMTIVSLVVGTDGSYNVYLNGGATSVLTGGSTGANSFISIVPGVTGGAGGYGTYINVGRNNPDGWTTFNGNIGDVFLYKTALTLSERGQLEQYIANKLTDYAITASAGTGGSISPLGTVIVQSGTNQAFTIAPSVGYAIANVVVDSVSKGAISSFTFTSVSASHTISTTFSALTYTIDASAGTGGSIAPSGTITKNYGTSQAFTIASNPGYAIVDVVVDGVSKGAISTWTFSSITANHTISATFMKPVGLNNKAALTDDKLIGRVVKIWGKVKNDSRPTSFTIDDGYGAPITVQINGVTLPVDFGIEKMAVIVGILDEGKTVQAQDIDIP